tara:strand:+ start:1778 stop:2050 length:273 start_codon:yes stop_codon:yes gene_type:complete
MDIKFKKTPILFLSILFVPICVFGAIYYLFIENNGGMALAGTIFLIALFVNLTVLAIEQTGLKKDVNMKNVWIVEISLIIVAFIYLKFFY